MKKLTFDSVVMMMGTGINSVLGIVFYVLVARLLNPSDFGLVAVILTLAVVVTDIFDLGLNTAIVKFQAGSKESRSTLFSLKILMVILVLVVGVILSPIISLLLFSTLTAVFLVYLGFVAAAATIAFGYFQSYLIAQKKILEQNLLNISSNSLRIVLVVISIWYGQINPSLIIVCYIFAIAGVIPIIILKNSGIIPVISLNRAVAFEVVHFSKWIAASLSLGTILSRVDNFLLLAIAGPFQTGIYSSVQRVYLAINQLPAAVGTVLSPDLASLERGRIISATKFGLLVSVIISGGLVLGISLTDELVPLVLGSSYNAAIDPAKFYAIGSIFFILSIPASSLVTYTESKSKFVFGVTLLQFAIVLISNLILIPSLGAKGAALSYAFTMLGGLIFYHSRLILYLLGKSYAG